MKNKRLLLLGLCAVACLAILSILYASSPLSKEIYRANFERNIEPDVFLEMKAILDLKFNSFYFAGTSKTKIYLGNSTAPAYLLVTNKTLSDSQRININIELDSVKEIRRFRIAIDSPYFFISHGTLPQILRGTIGSWNAKPIMNDSNYYFIEAVPISKNTFALRSYSTLSKGYELAKKTTDSFKFEPTLLEKQIDGMFCTDGTLHFDKSKNQLVYLYYYRNQYIVADTNMNLTYRGQTIDTFRTARIQVSQIGNENEMMLSAPPVQTNGTSYVADGMLYVQSHLMAKNEDAHNFKSKSIIDVYDLSTGSYKRSFYIPSYDDQKLSTYIVSDRNLYAIFDHYLIQYQLNYSHN